MAPIVQNPGVQPTPGKPTNPSNPPQGYGNGMEIIHVAEKLRIAGLKWAGDIGESQTGGTNVGCERFMRILCAAMGLAGAIKRQESIFPNGINQAAAPWNNGSIGVKTAAEKNENKADFAELHTSPTAREHWERIICEWEGEVTPEVDKPKDGVDYWRADRKRSDFQSEDERIKYRNILLNPPAGFLVFWADGNKIDGGEGHCGVSVGLMPRIGSLLDRGPAVFGKKIDLTTDKNKDLLLYDYDTTNLAISTYVDQWPDRPTSHKNIHGQYDIPKSHPGKSHRFLGVSKVWLPANAKSFADEDGGSREAALYDNQYYASYNMQASAKLVYDSLRKVNFSPEIAAILTCIAERESNLMPGQINPNLRLDDPSKGDWSIGLFQMNLLTFFDKTSTSVNDNLALYALPYIMRENGEEKVNLRARTSFCILS